MQDDTVRLYQRLLDEIGQLLRDVHETAPKKIEGEASAEIHDRLDLLEGQIRAFAEIHDKALAKHGVDPQDLLKTISGRDKTIPKPYQDLLLYAERLRNEARLMRRAIELASGKETEKKTPKKQAKQRKKKFKRLGGDDKWIPM